jgi:hypothetical protein
MRTCSLCGEEYTVSKDQLGRPPIYCSDTCSVRGQLQKDRKFHTTYRPTRIERTYGLSPEAHVALYEKQNRACALCKDSYPMRVLVVDHDHNTKAVRGLLCRGCNMRLGWWERRKHQIHAYVGGV